MNLIVDCTIQEPNDCVLYKVIERTWSRSKIEVLLNTCKPIRFMRLCISKFLKGVMDWLGKEALMRFK